MANMITDNEKNVFVLSHEVEGAGSVTHTLATQNKFIDKNIEVTVDTPAAGTGSLAINDNTSTDVSIGTAAGGKYPVSADLTGTMSFATAGWIGAAGTSATDSGVQVGQIDQSTLVNGSTSISSGAQIIPAVDADQTITISDGYYDVDRTVVVKSMSDGTAAAATVSGTAQATTPTLANASGSALTGKTQVSGAPVASSALTNEVDKYYMAVTAGAPATTIDLSKSVDTAGYLGANTQIDASAATTAASQLYYVPLTTGSVASTVDAVTVTPTVADDSSASIAGKTRITATPSTDDTDVTTDFYIAVKATAPATTINITNTVTPGYVDDAEVSETAGSTTAADATYYVPIAAGGKSGGAGSVAVSSSNVSLTETNNEPASGYYFEATGYGTVNIDAGYFNANTTQNSNAALKYYTIPQATFTSNGSTIVVQTAGYIGQGDSVGAVNGGTLSTGMDDLTAQGYTTLADNSVVIPHDASGNTGYLYIPAGYYNSTQISLATLIPDEATADAASLQILSGYEAYDTDGNRLVGAITTYDGTYTTV